MKSIHGFKRHYVLCILLAITAHSFLMNGFYHVHRYNTVGTYYESVMAAVDPTLFKNSIFVQAVERTNLRMSPLFKVIPYVLHYVDFEIFALIQGFLSLFFTIAGIYALGYCFFNCSFTGLLAALLYTVQLNNWTLGSPAPYLNFFHHSLPYSYPLMIWSLFFFFRKKYGLSVFLAGISWNFHSMCTFFFLCAYTVYFLLSLKEFKVTTIVSCLLLFALPASPSIVQILEHMGSSQQVSLLWLRGVNWTAWYTCFPFTWPVSWFVRAGFFFLLFIMCFLRMEEREVKRRIAILVFAVALLCLAGTVFSQMYPIPIIIKISLWRSTFIYLVIALPCIAHVLKLFLAKNGITRAIALIFFVFLSGYLEDFEVYYFPFLLTAFALLLYERRPAGTGDISKGKKGFLVFLLLLPPFLYQLFLQTGAYVVAVFFAYVACFVLLYLKTGSVGKGLISPVFLGVVFIALFDIGVFVGNNGSHIYYKGIYRGEKDPWADVQMYAKSVSQKDDLFIIPPYLNDFSNYSDRAVLGDWSQGANIIYLDNVFTEQWFARMNDLGWTSRNNAVEGFAQLTTEQIIRVAEKYDAQFVVVEKTKTFDLHKVYENKDYILYGFFSGE